MAAERQSDTAVTDKEVCMKQRCGIEFLYAEKMANVDIYQCQRVDVSTLRCVSAVTTVDSCSDLCRLLFIASENAQLMVVAMMKNSVL